MKDLKNEHWQPLYNKRFAQISLMNVKTRGRNFGEERGIYTIIKISHHKIYFTERIVCLASSEN